ncbi:Up-regulated during septation-domain-containing protein [Gymnopilus junonius]|uniref:Up-regulated during septation-domain-containing protein n=1 Tax=Gymnopilus junonius TaxID=109634 RepID=A0A9P5P049_GYMJU|nr:Up-regulated during septation-domain-containing protein [Gymnopilus junonius]
MPASPASVRASSPRRPMSARNLIASEAVIDSRDFEILTAEEVDELKKEHHVLSSRHEALSKKLALETKIRDAALSLSRVNASHKQVSKQTAEQVEAAHARVDKAQTELWKVSDRLNDVHNRLMEHRAGVLSFSVRNMERKMNGPDDSGYDSSNRSTLLSPTLPSINAAAAEILALETRLKEAKEALSSAGKRQVEMTRELSMMRLEKQEIETVAEMDLQAARDTIAALEKNKGEEKDEQLKALDEQVENLRMEREEWQMDKEEWERERDDLLREKEDAQVDAEELRQKLEEIEMRKQETEGGVSQELEEKNREIQSLQQEMNEMRSRWDEERRMLEDEKLEDLARLQEEMEDARRDAATASATELAERLREQERLQRKTNEQLEIGLAAVQTMVKTHGIVLFSRDNSLQGLLNAIGMHLDSVHKRLEAYAKSEAEWDILRRRLEEDVRSGLDKRETIVRELEEARKERDPVRRDTLTSESSRARSQPHSKTPSTPNIPQDGEPQDAARIIAVLQPLWSVLPSPEARAAKFASTRSFRTGSPTPGTPGGTNTASSTGVVASLSDLDVRSLKTLYDPRNNNSTPASPKPGNNALFTVEAFAQRVQALMADDKALIERLVRFAQAHDLLKKNAERAQKLAQEGTHALETYQKQVRVLEERNASLASKQIAMQEEFHILHDTIERITAEKHDLEGLAAEQAETCRQLTEANNTLSARTLHLAEEAAQAPEMIRKQLETQIGDLKKSLELARDEVDAMKSSEQSQRIALLDELNTMQTENGNLRSQLRALKK